MAELLTIAEAAHVTRLSTRSIRRALKAAHTPLRCYRWGRTVRIAPADLKVWVQAHRALPVVAPTVLDRLSPVARTLLEGLIRTPAAPGTRNVTDSQARPADRDNGRTRPTRGGA